MFWARSGQGWSKVGARSGQKARFGQGRGKLAAIPIYFTIIITLNNINNWARFKLTKRFNLLAKVVLLLLRSITINY